MQNKNWIVWVGILIAIVIAAVLLFGRHSAPQAVGSNVNGGNVTDYTALNVDVGYWVAGTTKVINASGVWLTGIAASALAQFDAGVLHSYPLSTSTPASLTLAASDIGNYQSLIILPTVGDITVTLPASSTLSALAPTAGDWQELCIVNATTSATAGIITLVGGTGVNLQVASSTGSAVGVKVLRGGATGCIKFIRIGAGASALDINAALTVFK